MRACRVAQGAELALALCVGAAARVAADQITDIAMITMVPRLTIQGAIGATNQIQYTNNLGR